MFWWNFCDILCLSESWRNSSVSRTYPFHRQKKQFSTFFSFKVFWCKSGGACPFSQISRMCHQICECVSKTAGICRVGRLVSFSGVLQVNCPVIWDFLERDSGTISEVSRSICSVRIHKAFWQSAYMCVTCQSSLGCWDVFTVWRDTGRRSFRMFGF